LLFPHKPYMDVVALSRDVLLIHLPPVVTIFFRSTRISDDLPPTADIDLAKENERLRKENRLLMEERDILKKATVFFANQSK
jgi:hypothetical protein